MADPTQLVNGLNPETPQLRDAPSDTIPRDQADPGIDEDHLSGYILELLRNDIADKEEFGWVSKRQYDVKAYYGLKDLALSQWPWPNASNFPQPLTPTLVDTGHANILASMYSKADKLVSVRGIGPEDVRKAPLLEGVMNWQLTNEVDMYAVQDANVFRSFLHGTGTVKVMQDFTKDTVRPVSLDIENIFLPIDASGFQKDDTDHVFQIIPLTYNDIQYRKGMTIKGKPLYKNLDEIPTGFGVTGSITQEQMAMIRDVATGTSIDTRTKRDMRYLMECWLTYYPKNSFRPKELIVWISPNGGRIQRVAENKEGVRPFAETQVYPNHGRFWSMSLPEKIKNIQENLDYAYKQNTDALDRAISPAAFIDDTAPLDTDTAQRVPGGIYPMPRGAQISYEPQPPVERGFERQIEYLWEMGGRVTGLNDVLQGISPLRQSTLGETQIRSARAEVRFATLFDRFERGWKKQLDLIYYYNDRYMPRNKKVRILGYADYQSIDELFPKDNAGSFGLQMDGKFDFAFGGSPVTEIERQRQDDKEFCLNVMANPLVMTNPSNLWKITKKQADAYGIKNLEELISKPPEANILSAEEAIQRIIAGQYDITPRPGIDTENYLFEIQLFAKTETFQNLDPQAKMALAKLFNRVDMMRMAELQAAMDLQTIQAGQMAQAAAQALPQPGAEGGEAPEMGMAQ